MITTCPAPEPLLFSLMNNEPLKLTLPTDATTSTVLFSWSDFPCQGDDLMLDDVLQQQQQEEQQQQPFCECVPYPPPPPPPNHSPRKLCSASFRDHQVKTGSPRPPLPPSPRSSMELDLDDDASSSCDGDDESEVGAGAVHKNSNSSNSNSTRRVSFSPVLRVRTYTVVLGDHPCCSGGMALQCGWEFAEDADAVPLRRDHQHRRTMAELRLSYAERRERLQEMTGLTGCQLLHEEYLLLCCGNGNGTSGSNKEPHHHQQRRSSCGGIILHHAPTLQQLAASSVDL